MRAISWSQGYVGKVLGTAIVGSGIAWTTVSDSAHSHYVRCAKQCEPAFRPRHAAIDAEMQFVIGDLTDIRATSAVRNPVIGWRTPNRISSPPRRIISAIAATLESGAVASIFYRGGTSRGENFRWEINGSDGDLVLTSPVGNLQVLAPDLFGGRGKDAAVAPLDIPSEYDLGTGSLEGPGANVARLLCGLRPRSPGWHTGRNGTRFRARSAPSQDARRDRARSRQRRGTNSRSGALIMPSRSFTD